MKLLWKIYSSMKKKMELILNCYNYFETKQDAQN